MASTHIEENRKHAAQNQDCPLIAGTISCLSVTWVHEDGQPYGWGEDTPCQSCDWWAEMCSEEDE